MYAKNIRPSGAKRDDRIARPRRAQIICKMNEYKINFIADWELKIWKFYFFELQFYTHRLKNVFFFLKNL